MGKMERNMGEATCSHQSVCRYLQVLVLIINKNKGNDAHLQFTMLDGNPSFSVYTEFEFCHHPKASFWIVEAATSITQGLVVPTFYKCSCNCFTFYNTINLCNTWHIVLANPVAIGSKISTACRHSASITLSSSAFLANSSS